MTYRRPDLSFARPWAKRLQNLPAAFLGAAAFCLSMTLPTLSNAASQDLTNGPRAMLVMDGSNSMWGQIEGTAKITVARDVIRDLLADLPQDYALGLTAYGHRNTGDCHDVEVMVQPGHGNRSEIADQIGAIKPKGKTPMAEAVRKAAEALGSGTAPATVILVSDGVETCAPDVCAVAAELERSGVDFTAHVIGFDVKEDEAQTQFACIAKATGGRYMSVNTAEDLSAALIATTQFASTETSLPLITQSGRLYFVASQKMRGKLQNLPAHWQLEDQSGRPIMTGFHNNGGQIDLKPGSYRLTATHAETGKSQSRSIQVTNGGTMQITLMFP